MELIQNISNHKIILKHQFGTQTLLTNKKSFIQWHFFDFYSFFLTYIYIFLNLFLEIYFPHFFPQLTKQKYKKVVTKYI